MLKLSEKPVYRIIDANINRAKEGLRVCEEIARFTLENRTLSSDFKAVRHAVSAASAKLAEKIDLAEYRESREDIGKNILGRELRRRNIKDIFLANIQRAKESLRVLEEFSKLKDPRVALTFKNLRYALYDIEKKSLKKISDLSALR